MEDKVLKAAEKFALLDRDTKTVTVALSGGADSMALLNVMRRIADKRGFTVKAAHLNHMIRGDEALRDEEFVKRQCEALGVELFCERADVPRAAKEIGISTELAARRIRYEFLERVSEGTVATAHTASDNLETVLFNLTRGTAIDGLCGIPPRRGIFIRPLIFCTRADIENFCAENSIPYVTDSTNLSDEYTRNRIRHRVIPVLRELNPSAESTVLRMCAALREASDFLTSEAERFLSDNMQGDRLNASALAELHPSLAKKVIVLFVKTQAPHITLEAVHIEAVLSALGKSCKISLPGNLSACISPTEITVKSNTVQNTGSFVVNITESENIFFKSTKKINSLLLNNSLDCDKIIGKSVVRTRRSGDSIRLKGRGCTKTLNRLFGEAKIPAEMRDSIPVIADDEGVVWVCGFGAAQRCAVTEKTTQALIIEAEEASK